MQDVLLGIITVLIFVVMYSGTPTSRKTSLFVIDTVSNEVDETCQTTEGFQYIPTERLQLLEENIIETISVSNNNSVRDKVVMLLRELSEYTDTTDFLERNPDIHKCIFFEDA